MYLAVIPCFLGLLFYTFLHIGDFLNSVQGTRTFNIVLVAQILVLSFFIPFSYGKTIFDIPIYPVKGLDCVTGVAPRSGNVLLGSLVNSINSRNPTQLYYMMGHTSGREVFFAVDNSAGSLEMLLVDSSLIRMIQVDRVTDNVNKNTTLRWLVDYVMRIKGTPSLSALDQKATEAFWSGSAGGSKSKGPN